MLKTGTVLDDKWVILESLGKGGMGEVYRAHQLSLKRDVAIKIVSGEWLETLDGDEEQLENAISRFRREVKATASIRHPNIVQIIDYGSATQEVNGEEVLLEYIVMEYIPGATLRFTMSEEGFEPDEELVSTWIEEYFFAVLEGVEAIHASGIVHRDLKPENVLMDGNIPRIVDFGLATSSRLEPITGSVDVKGTAAYMSPEQFVDLKRTDVRTDIYALGKILHEAITGKMPPTTIPFKTVKLDRAETPFFKKLDQILRTATAEKKEDRFDSVIAFEAALKEALAEEETTRHKRAEASGLRVKSIQHVKWVWVGIFVTLLAVSAMTVWHLVGEPRLSPFKDEEPWGVISEVPPSATRERPLSDGEKGSQAGSPSVHVLPKMSRGKDGAALQLVPGGSVTVPDDFGPRSGKPFDLPPFYMDETLVTNHQYVEFLNEMLSKIELEHGVVRGEGKIWVLLGEVVDGYDPVAFRDGKFHVTKPAHALCPVVRVTPYGASAYAIFFGRRLPTDVEWLHAVREGGAEIGDLPGETRQAGVRDDTGHMMGHMQSEIPPTSDQLESPPFPSPVIHYRANALGIRGLNQNISEWGIGRYSQASGTWTGVTENVILGGLDNFSKKGIDIPNPIPRRPWEAFEEVGFRCVVTASKHLSVEN